MIDCKCLSDHTFLGLKILQWLSITYRIEFNLLSKVYKAFQDLALRAPFFPFCCHPYLVLCANKALAITSYPCHLTLPRSLQHIPLEFRVLNLCHDFSSAFNALLILLCHHPSWPSLTQHFILQDASLLNWSTPDAPIAHGHISPGP